MGEQGEGLKMSCPECFRERWNAVFGGNTINQVPVHDPVPWLTTTEGGWFECHRCGREYTLEEYEQKTEESYEELERLIAAKLNELEPGTSQWMMLRCLQVALARLCVEHALEEQRELEEEKYFKLHAALVEDEERYSIRWVSGDEV